MKASSDYINEPNTSPIVLSVEQVDLAFSTEAHILKQASLELKSGEIACLLGESGCGKTTLLRCIAGLEEPNQGQIHIDGSAVFTSAKQLPPEQRDIGMVFQDYALFPHLSVAKNILFGLKKSKDSSQEKQNILNETLSLLNLNDQKDKYPHQLSGGQQQRVAIGRAIVSKPKLLLLDEPFSNLDLHLRERLARDLRQLLKSRNITALMVTHDQLEAFAFADTIGIMHQGQLEQWGSANEIYHHPASAYVANFIGDGVVISKQHLERLGLREVDNQARMESEFFCLRPEHIELCSDDSQPSAVITALYQQGHSQLLRCHFELEEGGFDLLVRGPADQVFEIGSLVNFRLLV